MRWFPVGPHALLFRFAEQTGDAAFEMGRSIAAELECHPPSGLLEFVPAFTSVLLEFDPEQVPKPELLAPALVEQLSSVAAKTLPMGPVREIPVTYDGPDLQRVADHARLSPGETITRHAAVTYKVYMLGFAPGFPYLGDLDPRLHTPRLASPRLRVPAGSVAIGGEHTGIYSTASPGGWNIIGRTRTKIFDPERGRNSSNRSEMFYLKPGDRLRFVPVPAE